MLVVPGHGGVGREGLCMCYSGTALLFSRTVVMCPLYTSVSVSNVDVPYHVKCTPVCVCGFEQTYLRHCTGTVVRHCTVAGDAVSSKYNQGLILTTIVLPHCKTSGSSMLRLASRAALHMRTCYSSSCSGAATLPIR
jgi:hypothetical protein